MAWRWAYENIRKAAILLFYIQQNSCLTYLHILSRII
jgi:hypothetical protein